MVIIFFIGRHIDDFVGDARVHRIAPVDLSVRCLNKTILVDTRIACQGVDQTDVGTFGSLDRAHSSVVCIVNVSDLESCTVSGKTAGAQCGQTSLVCQFAQRVVLVHELGQLGRSEEFLDSSLYRFDVDQALGRDLLGAVVGRHPLADNSLHSGETDPVLVLKKFTDAADSSVAQMVDVVAAADPVFQVHVVVDGSKDVFLRNVLRDQLVNTLSEGVCKRFGIRIVLILKEDLSQRGIVNQFSDSEFFGIAVHVVCDVDHQVAEHLDIALFRADPHIGDRAVLDLVGHLSCYDFAGCPQNIAVCLIHYIFRQDLVLDAASESELLVEFVSADLGEIISAGIKEHRVDQAVRALDGKRLAGTDLLVQFQKTALVVVGDILDKAGADLGLITEEIEDLLIGADSERTNEDRDRNLPGAVYSDIEYVVRVRLILQPGASVGDHRAGEELLAEFILIDTVIDAGGTDQLADDDTLRAVDHERSRARHKRKISHEDLLFLDFLVVFLVEKTHFYHKRCCVSSISFLALLDGILDFIFAEFIADKGQTQPSAEILDRRDVIKDLLQTLLKKPLVRIRLHFDQVGHGQHFLLTLITHAHALAFPYRMYPVFFHLVHPVLYEIYI